MSSDGSPERTESRTAADRDQQTADADQERRREVAQREARGAPPRQGRPGKRPRRVLSASGWCPSLAGCPAPLLATSPRRGGPLVVVVRSSSRRSRSCVPRRALRADRLRDGELAGPERRGQGGPRRARASRRSTPTAPHDLFRPRATCTPRTGSSRWTCAGTSPRAGSPSWSARPALETDKVIRTMGWRRVAEAELPTLNPATRHYLQAYADGVNAYIHSRSSTSAMALEYAVLGQQVPDYTVEDWTPAGLPHLAQGDGLGPARRLQRRARRGPASPARCRSSRSTSIFPPYPYASNSRSSRSDWPPLVHARGSAAPSAVAAPGRRRDRRAGAGAADGLSRSAVAVPAQAAYAGVQAALAAVPAAARPRRRHRLQLLGRRRRRAPAPASRCWPTTRTSASGIPGIWYQVGLHCRSVSAPARSTSPASRFAGLPGVVIGHNQSIAWGLTNLGPDVSDFYLEQVQGDTDLRDGSRCR